MVFQWFPMVANHWSNDGMVTIHRYGLIGVLFWVPFSISQHTNGIRLNSWLGRWLELVNTISFWEKSGDAPSLYPSDHHPSPNISFRHHSSHCKKGWVKMGWTNEFRLMSSEENNRLWQMWINHLTANADDWIWKIHDFLGEIQRRSKGSVDITCLLGLTNAKRPNQQIHIYIGCAQIQTSPWGPILISSSRHVTCICWNVLSSR